MDFDMRIVAHARDYIQDMARGIDPLTKREAGEEDLINNVKISRCLFYVTDVLNAVLENGGVGRPVKPVLDDFDPSRVPLDRIEFSAVPVAVSVLVKKINDLKPDNMKALNAVAVTNWLVDAGVLQIVQINGRNYKDPGPEAKRIGITQVQREGPNGPYRVNMYGESAQRFIVDNLQAVVDGGYNKPKKKEGPAEQN